ncbi:MAG: tetratricopeptide repeat-containing sensor histidine kinase [Emticicia sp.]|uniref:tetratricopeptide repeat-containing sensor histidine kinase n=1 Tax=Emticicia sp. TaxID=1930953 RepID=UPI003BA62E39
MLKVISLNLRKTKILLIFLLTVIFTSVEAQYPYVDNIYTKHQLDSMILSYQAKNDTLGLAFTHWAYAKNQENSKSLNESPITNLRKSMEYFYAAKDYTNYYNIKGTIGSFFMDKEFMKQLAKDYIESAVYYFRASKNILNEAGHLVNLANIYIHENNFRSAKEILERVEMLNQQIKNKSYQGRIHSSYADYYARQAKYKEAFYHIELSYEIAREEQIEWLEVLALYFKSKCYQSLNNEEARKETLLATLNILEKNMNLYLLRKEIYDNLRDYYFKKKNFAKAYEYAYKAQITVETIYFSKMESDLRSFTEYNLLEKQKMIVSTIALEKKIAQNELEKLRTEQNIYIGVILGIILFFCLLIYLYFNRRKIELLKKSEAENNYQIESLNSLINGQEIERERIAKELHDGLGIMLARIKFTVEKSSDKERITKMIDDVCSEIRNISTNLQPTTLSEFGLKKAIEDFVLKHDFSEPNLVFQFFGEPLDLGTNKNLMVYRIVQELVTNSIKHANAKEILIQIINTTESMTLTIEDDGIGFDENTIKTDSSGWKNIKSRANYLQSNISLTSDSMSGTSVTITMPHH